ncbi:GNAT family N-acetyltransferase [Halobacillus locisalis]|uniref:GNAT family N-acetyltransferase n=1 Tax=Halobacillus locisalis TaxID=220753 RepID=A0A838CWE9_9BACI|nr:GNAT family N-acetyltransferase [Halobacillus locisalis]MBA2176367.1 GNAT family N-acetyltransferase [Halobacillus locisalis]
MVELTPGDFHRCEAMVDRTKSIEVNAIIKGNNPGRIFVDHKHKPETGMVWLGNNAGFYFIGQEDNDSFNQEINHFIDEYIVKQAKKENLEEFEAVGQHPRWDEVIQRVFQHRKLHNWNQRVYKLHSQNYKAENEPLIAGHYQVVSLTFESLENTGYSNRDFVESKVLDYWETIDDFSDKGFGFMIINQQEIVSLCFSAYVFEGVHGVHIETLPPYQGKGLAQKVAHKFVQDCFTNGTVPYWNCLERNQSCIAIVENMGFTNVFNYVGYEFPLYQKA